MDEFAAKYSEKMVFRYLDADDYEDIFAELEIANMPTFRIYREGVAHKEMFGTKLDKIEAFITSNCWETTRKFQIEKVVTNKTLYYIK